MSVRELIRENPWKSLIGSVSAGTIIFTLVGSIFTEIRYVSKEEFEKTEIRIQELEKKITELSEK